LHRDGSAPAAGTADSNITSKGRSNDNFVKALLLGMPTKKATRERAVFVFGSVI